MKVPFCDFTQKLSKCLSKWIKVDKWDYFIKTNPHRNKKFLFVYGSYESLERLEVKIGKAPFFKVRTGKITM